MTTKQAGKIHIIVVCGEIVMGIIEIFEEFRHK